MEAIFITNGGTRLVLIPEKEIERILLEELLSKGYLQADLVKGPVDVLGTPAQGGLLLTPKESDVTSKEENVRRVQLHANNMEEQREAEVL